MNTWTDAVVPWLADFYLLASVLMLGAVLAMRWVRQPVQRVALGWAVVGTTLALAAVTAMPCWPRIYLVSARPVESSVPIAAPRRGLEPMAGGRGSEAALERPLAIPPRPSAGPVARDDMRESQPGPVAEPMPAFVAERSSWIWSDARQWLAGAFLAGSALAGLWLAVGAVEAMWLRRKAVAAPASLQDRLREIVGPKPRAPRLLLSRHVGNAVALGVLRPTILLPAGLAEETDERGVWAVLAHEWAHVRNRDLWLLALVRSLLVVLFPHPLYWWLRHTIRTSQESLADAVAAADRQADYAEDLVAWMRRIAGHDRVRIAAAVGIWEGPSQLSRRIAMLVDDSFCVQLRSSRSWKCCAWACVGLVALGLSPLTLRPMPPLAAAEALVPSAPSLGKRDPEEIDKRWSWVITSSGEEKDIRRPKSLELRSRYAQAIALVAKVAFEKAEEANRMVPGTAPAIELRHLELERDLCGIEVEYWEAVRKGDEQAAARTVARYARVNAECAQNTLEKANYVNRKVPGTVPEIEVRQLELQRDRTRLQVKGVEAQLRSDSKRDVPPALPPNPNAPGQLPAPLTYTGVVKDYVTGQPIEGATVNVRRQILTATEHKTLLETKHTTDKQGKYTFTIPPKQVADDYLYVELDALHPGYVSQRHFGYALSMILKNEKLGVRPFFETVELGPAVRLSGTVVDPDGKPAVGIAVPAYTSPKPNDLWGAQSLETKTDARGQFHLDVYPTGTVLIWFVPEQFAPSMHVIDMKLADLGRYVSSFVARQLAPSGRRGEQKGRDLGRFVLEKGMSLQGRIVDLQGKPVAGVWVEADLESGPAKKPHSLPVGDGNFCRASLTDAQGRFTLRPLPPSDYLVNVRESHHDPLVQDAAQRPVPGVFVSQSVTLAAGKAPPAIELRAVPEAVVEVHYVDSAGKPTWGPESILGGKIGADYFWIRAEPDGKGAIIARVPKGLTGATMDLITNEHTALRHRVTKNGPLCNGRLVRLGSVDRDMREVTVIRYEAPIVVVKAISEDGRPIQGSRVQGQYPEGRRPLVRFVLDGQPSDISFYGRGDGGWQSSQLLPDESFALTVQAPGYQPVTEKLSLPEGAVKELAVKMKKR